MHSLYLPGQLCNRPRSLEPDCKKRPIDQRPEDPRWPPERPGREYEESNFRPGPGKLDVRGFKASADTAQVNRYLDGRNSSVYSVYEIRGVRLRGSRRRCDDTEQARRPLGGLLAKARIISKFLSRDLPAERSGRSFNRRAGEKGLRRTI